MPPVVTNQSKVTPASSILKPRGLEPPVRRVLAVDAGSRCIRLLLLESRFGKLRVQRQEVLDLQEEGLVSADELKAFDRHCEVGKKNSLPGFSRSSD